MNETETKDLEEQRPAQEPLSPRRRTALVTYLSILFAVAFLFVALVMVVEARRLKTMNEELQDSSQKTSASLTNNINALQEENRKLSEDNDALTEKIQGLEEAARKADEEKTGLLDRIDQLNEEKRTLDVEKTQLQEQIKTLSGQLEDAVTVSELLHKAVAADEAGDLETLQELLDQIEPLRELLSPTEQEIYEELKIA